MKFLVFCLLLAGALAAPSMRLRFPRTNYKIVGGTDATLGEFPYQLSFQDNSYNPAFHFCGASIYDENHAITAGHCVYGENYDSPKNLQIVAGELDLSSDDGSEQTIAVSKITLHENFDYFVLDSDIAILHLASPLTFNNNVAPIALPEQGHTATGDSIVTGWGTTSEGGSTPDVLQKVTIPIVTDAECRDDYGASEILDSMICAGVPEGGVDSCQGDSGGPLAASDTGSTYLAGIVSWGYGCARPGYPGVYTEVSYHVDWVKQNAVSMKFLVFCLLLAGALAAPSMRLRFPRTNYKIVGGTDATLGEFPYQLSFQDNSYNPAFHFCGASIYDENHAITAGHCVYGENYDSPKNLQIVAGELNLSADDGSEQTIAVSKITLHENFDYFVLDSDIAILHLASPLTFNNNVAPIALPEQGHTATGDSIITGWGTTSEGGSTPDVLQKVTIPIVTDAECRDDYGASEILDSMICAGVPEGGVDSCQGDSGGPLAASDTGSTYLAGIVSWGYGCARPGYPGVYTEVSYHVDWVKQNAV
ncbi:transmembrane protease serine 9-like [Procambarus clarkii]|uniref:transmembrane protease serine 9-like n=1 Tax=Procambarus clarkii TaxID=6728 RepID=UPI00374301D1